MTDHILIGGTGRAGTTLLVQVLTLLGFDTGYTQEQVLREVDDLSKAGLEHAVLGESGLPQVIKSPWLSDQIEDALRQGLRVSVAIIPLRDLFEAAESRRNVYRQAMAANLDALGHPGSLWKVTDPMEQESALAVELYKFLEPLVARNVPIVFLSFPRFVEDAGYFYDQMSSLFQRHGVSRAMADAVHKRLADPLLVHRFRNARAKNDRVLFDSEKRSVEAEAQRRAEAERLVADVERRIVVAQAEMRSDLEPKIAHAESQLAEMDARRRTEVEQLQLESSRHQSEVAALRRELEVILDSTIWRASAPLRMAAGKLPSSLKTMARTGLQAVYWVLTPWNTPRRLQYLRELHRQESATAVAVLETPPVDSRTDAPSVTVPAIEPDAPPAVTLRLHPVPGASEPRRPARSETTAPPFAGTIICLSHVFPLPPRAGIEYRIHRMLVRLRRSGYRIVLVVSPLSPEVIDDARWGALAAAYGNVVHCERDGQIRYRMDECPDVLAPLEGQRTLGYAALLDEVRPLPPAEAELLQVDRAFCPDALIATLIQLQSSLLPCAVLAEYVWMTRGLPLLDPGVLTVVDTMDALSSHHEKVGVSGWQVRPEDEAQRLARAQVLVAIHPEEARVLGNLAPGHEVVTAGVDFDVAERNDWPAKPVVFCVGSDNPRNLLGLRDFLKFAWPEIRSAVPDVRLVVAGSIGAAVPDYLQDVDVLGPVDDLDPVYRRARVVVNPAVAGTGLKIKTVEALSRLRPIVTWPNGADGLPPELAELVAPAQDWLEFAERVIAWLRSETPAFNAETTASIRHLLSSDHVYAELEARLARYFDARHSRQP